MAGQIALTVNGLPKAPVQRPSCFQRPAGLEGLRGANPWAVWGLQGLMGKMGLTSFMASEATAAGPTDLPCGLDHEMLETLRTAIGRRR